MSQWRVLTPISPVATSSVSATGEPPLGVAVGRDATWLEYDVIPICLGVKCVVRLVAEEAHVLAEPGLVEGRQDFSFLTVAGCVAAGVADYGERDRRLARHHPERANGVGETLLLAEAGRQQYAQQLSRRAAPSLERHRCRIDADADHGQFVGRAAQRLQRPAHRRALYYDTRRARTD